MFKNSDNEKKINFHELKNELQITKCTYMTE